MAEGTSVRLKPADPSVRAHLLVWSDPVLRGGHTRRAGLLHRPVRRRRLGLLDERAAGRGLLPSRPLEHAGRRRCAREDRRRTRRRAGPPGGLGMEAPGLRAIGMGPEARRRAGGDLHRAAIAGRRHAYHPRRPGNQYVTVPTTVAVLLTNVVLTFQTPYARGSFPISGWARAWRACPSPAPIPPIPASPASTISTRARSVGDGPCPAIQGRPEMRGGQEPASVRRRQIPHHQSHQLHVRPDAAASLPDGCLGSEHGPQSYNSFVAGLQVNF